MCWTAKSAVPTPLVSFLQRSVMSPSERFFRRTESLAKAALSSNGVVTIRGSNTWNGRHNFFAADQVCGIKRVCQKRLTLAILELEVKMAFSNLYMYDEQWLPCGVLRKLLNSTLCNRRVTNRKSEPVYKNAPRLTLVQRPNNLTH